jgi:ribonuclease BN (tRNA processing enzyme)
MVIIIERHKCQNIRPDTNHDLHTPPRQIGEAARDSNIKRLLLSDLAPDVEEQENAVRKSIQANFTGPIMFATDKMRVSISK